MNAKSIITAAVLAASTAAVADFETAILSKDTVSRCYEADGQHYSLVFQPYALDKFGTTLRTIAGYRWTDGQQPQPVSGTLLWSYPAQSGVATVGDATWVLDTNGRETTGQAESIRCDRIAPPEW